MNIIFGNWQEEIVYDNHGCPCRTDYRTTFTIDGVRFTAETNDLLRHIDVYHNASYVVTVYNYEKPITTDTAAKLIKAELRNNPHFQRAVKEQVFARLAKLNETLCQELLTSGDD